MRADAIFLGITAIGLIILVVTVALLLSDLAQHVFGRCS